MVHGGRPAECRVTGVGQQVVGDDLHSPGVAERPHGVAGAGGEVPEGEVVADDHGAGVEGVDDDAPEVLLRGPAGELTVEVDDEHRVDAVARGGDRPLFQRRQGRRDGVGPEEDGGVRVEGDHHRGHTEIARPLHRRGDELLVTPVNAVEDADGDDRARQIGRHLFQSVPDIHGHQNTT